MAKTATLTRIDIDEHGVMDVYFDLASDDELRQHSIQISPLDAPEERLRAIRAANVKKFGTVDVTDADWAKVLEVCIQQHTREVRAAYELWEVTQRAQAREIIMQKPSE